MVDEKKRILLITYYWPPAGGAGVQRWLKMSKYLAQDFNLSVFCPETPNYPIVDNSLKMEIPPQTIQITQKIWEPYQIAEKFSPKNKNYKKGNLESRQTQSFFSKVSLWIRANLFIPDARMFWIAPSIEKIKKYIIDNHVDVIISTGPPHSTHMIAMGLKKEFPDIVWLADFRDPWTKIDYFHQLPFTFWAIKKHKKLERKVLKKADIVTTVSPSWARDLEILGAPKVYTVYNGYDESDFNFKPKKEFVSIPEITYIGSLNEDRNPSFLWEAFDFFIRQNPDKKFKLKFIGNISEKTKNEIQKLEKLSMNTIFMDYMPHKEVLEHTKNSSILLLLMNDTPNIDGIIPGKFFEYLATDNPILAIGKKETDLDLLLKKTESGEMINFADQRGVYEFLEKYLDRKKSPNPSKTNYTRAWAANEIKNLIEQFL